MTSELGDIMLERDFKSLDTNGNSGTIKIRLGKPYVVSDSASSLKWHCPYQIIGVGSDRIRVRRGIDAIDAVLTCLRIIEALLKSNTRIKITWLGEEDLGLSYSSPVEISDQDKSLFETDDEFKKIFDEVLLNFHKKLKGT